MASPDEVKTHTGYTIGGVSPVGHINKTDILIDESLNKFEELFGAAGHPNCVFKINFEKLVKIKLHNYAKENPSYEDGKFFIPNHIPDEYVNATFKKINLQ